MLTAKKEVLSFSEPVVLPAQTYINESGKEVEVAKSHSFMFDRKSVEKAIDKYLKQGHPRDGNYDVWIHDTTDYDSDFGYPVNTGNVVGELLSLEIEGDKVFANIAFLGQKGLDRVKGLDFMISLIPDFDYNTSTVNISGNINGVVAILKASDLEITKGTSVIITSRSNGVNTSVVEAVRVNDDNKNEYLVDGLWFNNKGLLLNGRGVRITRTDGSYL